MGGWRIFWQSILDVGDGCVALVSSSGASTGGTKEVCLVTETLGGGTNLWLAHESSPLGSGLRITA